MKLLIMICFLVCSNCLADEFVKPIPGKVLSFPRDHGAHPEYMTEWWYLTGHLVNKEESLFEGKTRYGFQITFFRHKGDFLAHAALSDISNKTFIFDKRVSPKSSGLGFMSENYLSGFNQDYSIELVDNSLLVTFKVKDKKIRLISSKLSDVLLHGDKGFSRKSNSDSASYYSSLPGIDIKGDISSGSTTQEVSGKAWFDHEFSSGTISKNQVGWDWLSLMFKEGRSLMAFKVRGQQSSDDFYSGTLKDSKGNVKQIKDLKMIPQDLTNIDGIKYPLNQKIIFDGEEIEIAPLLTHQLIKDENNSKVTEYWEGAVSSLDGEARGYLELTGYREPLEVNEP